MKAKLEAAAMFAIALLALALCATGPQACPDPGRAEDCKAEAFR